MMNHVYTPQIPKPFVSSALRQLRDRGPVLEVGSHEGRNALYLASQGIEVVAIDIDESALAIAAVRAKQEGVEDLVSFELCDIQGLNTEPRRFGAVVCTEVFQDIDRNEWGDALDAMATVTVPSGLHVFSGYVNGVFGHDEPRAFHPGEAKILYEEHGFDVTFFGTDTPRVHDLGMEKYALCSLERVIAVKD